MVCVSVLVINWNGKKWLQGCLSSILLQEMEKDFEVILIDNGSTDGSVDYVKSRFPQVKVVELDRNYGFAEGNNRGVEYASGEYLIFVNMDIEVYSEWLAKIVRAADQHPEYKILCSMGFPDSENNFVRTVNAIGDAVLGVKCERDITDSLFAWGGGFLIRKKWLNKVGYLFDPYYFCYAEDLELSLRTILLGGRIGYVKDSKIWHFGGGSDINSEFANYLDLRNKLFTYYKMLSIQNFVRLCSAHIATAIFVSFRDKTPINLVTVTKAVSMFLFKHRRYEEYRKKFSEAKRVNDKDLFKRLIYKNEVERKLFKKIYRI
jgi:GT2 family glycosyltransferase